MKTEIYREIVSIIHSCWNRECFQTISRKFPRVTTDTLVSIFSQEYQKKIKKNHHRHHHANIMKSYYLKYLDMVKYDDKETVLLKLSQEVDLSPCIFARIVLEEYLSHTYCEGLAVPKEVINLMMKDSSLVPDARLSKEIQHCVLNDENSGPLVDNIRRSVGLEYENILEKKLREWKIPFLGENKMRDEGYDKTPDFKLQVPIAVDGHIVNWIESKASFGDESSHKTYLRDQFWSYWNRFGPGLVIYWFGYIDNLDCHRDKGILLMDNFPSTLTTLTSLVIDKEYE